MLLDRRRWSLTTSVTLVGLGLVQVGTLVLPDGSRVLLAILCFVLAGVFLFAGKGATLTIVSQDKTGSGYAVEIKTSRRMHPAALRLTWAGAPAVHLQTLGVELNGKGVLGLYGDLEPGGNALRVGWSDPPFIRGDRLRIECRNIHLMRYATVEEIDPGTVRLAKDRPPTSSLADSPTVQRLMRRAEEEIRRAKPPEDPPSTTAPEQSPPSSPESSE